MENKKSPVWPLLPPLQCKKKKRKDCRLIIYFYNIKDCKKKNIIIWFKLHRSFFSSPITGNKKHLIVEERVQYTSRSKWGPGRCGRTRSDPKNPSDSFGFEPDPIWFFKKVKLTRSGPIRFLLKGQTDPIRT
jgi:hypothetical protein